MPADSDYCSDARQIFRHRSHGAKELLLAVKKERGLSLRIVIKERHLYLEIRLAAAHCAHNHGKLEYGSRDRD